MTTKPKPAPRRRAVGAKTLEAMMQDAVARASYDMVRVIAANALPTINAAVDEGVKRLIQPTAKQSRVDRIVTQALHDCARQVAEGYVSKYLWQIVSQDMGSYQRLIYSRLENDELLRGMLNLQFERWYRANIVQLVQTEAKLAAREEMRAAHQTPNHGEAT